MFDKNADFVQNHTRNNLANSDILSNNAVSSEVFKTYYSTCQYIFITKYYNFFHPALVPFGQSYCIDLIIFAIYCMYCHFPKYQLYGTGCM